MARRKSANKWLFYTVEVATLLAGAAISGVNLWAVKDASGGSTVRHSRRPRGDGGGGGETVQVSRKLAALPGPG
jgi:hypothetical protein